MPTRTIVMGKGTLAIRVADWFRHREEYTLKCVVPVVPEPNWTDSLVNWCRKTDVTYVASGSFKDIDRVRDPNWRMDLVVSVWYDRIIPTWFIQKCGRILNLHNSPLPRYRGVSPINWALKEGRNMHGVTLHEISPEVDEGPIVAQLQYSIYPDIDEVIDVYNRALAYGWVLFEQTIPILDRITPRAQDEAEASYHGRSEDHLLGERRGFTRHQSALD
jgi:methionyl-tRNA formyltransferase